jgi:His-Xaa-Ser system radical SAM maturase HxsB
MSRFKTISEYEDNSGRAYNLLPFRFAALDASDYVVTNMAGEHHLLSYETLRALVRHKLSRESSDFIDLRAKQFVQDSHSGVATDLLALKVRTRYRRLAEFTALHIFVVTLRCEHSCPYCQVSRQTEDRSSFDMTRQTADKALDFVFRSPSPSLKIEFQGGEPFLNFELIRYIVESAEERNLKQHRNLNFVIATNLAVATPEMLQFCAAHSIDISTSIDGPEDLHNQNRPRPGRNSHQKAVEGINLARAIIGRDRVSALMTTTARSLDRVRDIIDEYVRLEFSGIFLRTLSPYGFAVKTNAIAAYTTERWIEFYKEGLEYILSLNRMGIQFREYFACVVLKKMLTSEETGFVDLTSPAGIGIKAIVYNYNGAVYASDESRMLAEMGDDSFRLGNLLTDSYEATMLSDRLLGPLEESMTISVPMCDECAFEPYCGADPVFHHAVYGDVVGRKPESAFCSRNMSIFRYLITKMRDDPGAKQLFLRWANG